jgi:hypothetical protein
VRYIRWLLVLAAVVVWPSVATAAQQIALEAEPSSLAVPVGDRPGVHLFIVNGGPDELTLVQSGDGSSDGWRTPLVGVSIAPVALAKHPPAGDTPVSREGRCGNINPLRAEEVVVLGVGHRLELEVGWYHLEPLDQVGTFEMVFYYENKPTLEWRGLPLGGGHDARAMASVQASTNVSLRSNPVVVTVLPK